MRAYTVATVVGVLVTVTGCRQDMHSGTGRAGDIQLVSMVNNIAVENAIITQHTLYPYHFEPAGAKLNELGLSDLDVLIRHYREHAGTLNLRRGETSNEVYQARILYVIDRLRKAGIERERVEIKDGMAGGPGMASEQVVEVMKKASATPLQEKGWSMGQSR
jgi:hypothetical protein